MINRTKTDKGKAAFSFWESLPGGRKKFYYEKPYWQYWIDDFPDNGIFYDIGAGFGYYPLLLSYEKSNPRIIAFEPSPDRKRALRETRDLNSYDWKLFDYILGNEERDIDVRKDYRGLITKEEGSIETLKMKKLDNLVEESSLPYPDVIKVDVEGFENIVFEGGIETFREASLIQVEVHEFGELGNDIEENEENFTKLVREEGFKIEKIFRDRPQHFVMFRYDT